MPERVSVYEVGPRDGLQAEETLVPLPVKLELIDRLGEAGLAVIEATSFVSARWVPQLADADELMTGLRRRPGVRYPVLVPNERGFERAMAVGADELAIFVSATETFAKQNLGTTLEGALEMAAPVVAAATLAEVPVRGYVSMCFGDPWEGSVDPSAPAEIAARLSELGCSTISLGDTIGVATCGPGHGSSRSSGSSRSATRPHRAPHARHVRSGSRERAGRTGGRHHRIRFVRWRTRWLPVRKIGDWESRHRGPGMDAGWPRHRNGCRPRQAGGHQPLARHYVGAAIAFTSGSGSGHLNGFGISVVVVGGRGTHGRHRRLRPRPEYRSSLG